VPGHSGKKTAISGTTEAPATDPPPGGTAATLLTLGGLATAFGAASCRALPPLLAASGLGSAWLGGVAVLAAPHRGVLLITVAVCLGGGAILLWQQRAAAAACAPETVCGRSVVRRLTAAGPMLGAAISRALLAPSGTAAPQ
jgi:mercuric ion transport protein